MPVRNFSYRPLPPVVTGSKLECSIESERKSIHHETVAKRGDTLGIPSHNDVRLEGLLARAYESRDMFLELIAKVQQAPVDQDQRNADFAMLAGHVKQQVLGDERNLFPLARKLRRLELDSVTAAMKKRKSELCVEMGIV